MENPTTTWKVNTEEGSVDLNSATLLDALLGKVLQTPKQDFDELIVNFGKFLQSRELFGDMKFNQLVGMSFAVGYFYRVFLEKNDVEISITDLSNAAEDETMETAEDAAQAEALVDEDGTIEEQTNEEMVSEFDDNAGSAEGDSPAS